MAEEIIIGKLVLDNSDLSRALLESKKDIVDLETAQKSLKKETDNLSNATEEQLQTFIANEAALKRARTEYNANQKTVEQLRSAQMNLDAALSQNIKTQDQAIANNKALVEGRRQLDTTTVAGAKAIAEINAKIDANNKLINGSSSALEQQKNNVGNYPQLMGAVSSSFGSATQSVIGFAQKGKDVLGEFSSTLDKVRETQAEASKATEAFSAAKQIEVQATEAANAATERATAIGFRYAAGTATQSEAEAANTVATVANAEATAARTAATEAGTVATAASTVATNVLSKAMLAIPLFALLALLAPLITFLTSTQEGMDAITSVTRPLVAIFDAFIDVLSKVGKDLFEAFSNPKKAINDLYEFVKNNIINRFKAFGVILEGIINLDFKKVANGVLQAGTGVENLTDKIASAAKSTSKFLGDAAAKGSEIDRLQKSIEESQLAFGRNQVKINDAIDEQLKKSKDTSLSFKEREKASREIIRLSQELGDEEAAIVQKRIDKLKIEMSLRDRGRKGQEEMIKLEQELDAAQDRGLDAQLEQTRVIAGARKEAAAQAKAAADKALQEDIKQRRNAIEIIKLEAKASDLTTEQRIANAQKIFALENELAKKSLSGSDQQKALLENRQALSSEVLAIAAEQIDKELEAQKKAFEERKKITQAERDAEVSSAEDLARAQILLLDTKLLTEKDYATQLVEINKGKNEAILLANTTFEQAEAERKAVQVENEKALAEVAFQIRLQDITDKGLVEGELKLALLTAQYEQEQKLLDESLKDQKISQDLYNQKKLLSDKQYASGTKAIEKEVANVRRANNTNMVKDGVNALGALFGESKAIAIAQALINTYEGITAGVALGYPMAIPAVAFAALTGFAAVRNILKTNKGSNSSGDSGAAATPVTTTGAGSFVNSSQTSTVATVSQAPVENNTVVSPPVLVVETLLEVIDNRQIKINSD